MTAAKGELYRQSDGSQQKLPWVNYTQQDPSPCPPILCKVRSLTTTACQSYKVCLSTQLPGFCKHSQIWNCRVAAKPLLANQAHQLCCLSLLLCVVQSGANTIAPGSQTISVDQGTVVAVAWLPENSTAWFSWRGSVSKKDWLADFQLWWVLCLIMYKHAFAIAAATLTHRTPSSADRKASHSK